MIKTRLNSHKHLNNGKQNFFRCLSKWLHKSSSKKPNVESQSITEIYRFCFTNIGKYISCKSSVFVEKHGAPQMLNQNKSPPFAK